MGCIKSGRVPFDVISSYRRIFKKQHQALYWNGTQSNSPCANSAKSPGFSFETKNEVYQKISLLGWIDPYKVGILVLMKSRKAIEIHPLSPGDQGWIEEFYQERWGSKRVVSRGNLYTVSKLPGFAAWDGKKHAGLLTYHISGENLEIVTMDSLEPNQGVGSVLIEEILKFAISKNLRRVWLITTNDNTPALHFYQKRGFSLVTIYKDAVRISRELKPEIPLVGLDGIPIRDEIELEFLLT